MTNEFQDHSDSSNLERDLKNLDTSKEGAFIFATRAPTASDKGISARVWVYRNGSTLSMYLLDIVSKTWKGPVNFT